MRFRCFAMSLLGALLISSAALAGTSANVPQVQANASPAQQELINTQKALLDAMDRGDSNYVSNALADDFVLIAPNGDNASKKEIVHDIRPSEHPGPKPILYDFAVVQLDSDCAVVSYKAVFPDGGMERYQSLSDTWVKQNGQWKLKFQQSTLNLWSAHDL